MYEPGTILALKEPRSTDDVPFAYDRIEVVGISPVSHAGTEGEWSGTAAQGVIVKPLHEFGSTLDEPYGRLRDLYTIESVPEKFVQRAVEPITYVQPGRSPEEIFEDAARDAPPVPEPKKKPSPLAETEKTADDA